MGIGSKIRLFLPCYEGWYCLRHGPITLLVIIYVLDVLYCFISFERIAKCIAPDLHWWDFEGYVT